VEEGAPDGCEIIAEDITAQRASEDHLRHLAATDALTGLANYRRLSETLESEIKRSDRTGRAFAVLVFDLDGMKRINDSYGHLAGNRALCRLADIFRFSCRSIDTAARYGGDEFAIILPETSAKEAGAVGRRICERLSSDGEQPLLSVSVGTAVYPEDGTTIESLFQAADRVLYKMKLPEKTP
jgi:diguanylate cyclase (GGDEF)-like protein